MESRIRGTPRTRTYSLILEVAKQLEKLEALSERLGSEGNGRAQLVSESCVNWEKRREERKKKGGLLPLPLPLPLPAWLLSLLLSFELFFFKFFLSFFSFLLVLFAFLFSRPSLVCAAVLW